MIVIHTDKVHTGLAQVSYANLEVRLVQQEQYERGIGSLLWQTPPEEPILMIGSGDSHGLYLRKHNQELCIKPSETYDMTSIDRLKACMDVPHYVVRNLHAYSLRKHRGDIIGIWPGAAEFARRNKLHGLFTDHFLFDYADAESCGIMTTTMRINEVNYSLYKTLGKLISAHVPLCQIPKQLEQCALSKLSLQLENHKNFICLAP